MAKGQHPIRADYFSLTVISASPARSLFNIAHKSATKHNKTEPILVLLHTRDYCSIIGEFSSCLHKLDYMLSAVTVSHLLYQAVHCTSYVPLKQKSIRQVKSATM